MGYTVVAYREATLPLVAIYESDGHYTAEPIIGIAVYRDLEVKASENVLVPMTTFDLQGNQEHSFNRLKDLRETLPRYVVQDEGLCWTLLNEVDSLGADVERVSGSKSWTLVSA